MKQYEYKFVEILAKRGFKDKAGNTFDACKQIIVTEAKNGWRLKQVVTPFNEKMRLYGVMDYQIIFEKENELNLL